MTNDPIAELTRRAGIATEFEDFTRNLRPIAPQARHNILRCMGFDPTEQGARDALQQLDDKEWGRVLPPVVIAREGARPEFEFNLPVARNGGAILCQIHLEEGGMLETGFRIDDLEVVARRQVDGQLMLRRSVRLDLEAPPGYHRLVLVATPGAAELASTPLLIAPQTCYEPEPLRSGGKVFGVTMQLYTLRSARNWGIGDFTDLKEFIVAAAPRGIDIVGLNPLHALFPANPLHFSPYVPSNRAFLNVMYIDVEAVPEFGTCEAARQLVNETEFQSKISALRATTYVNYTGVAESKLAALELLFERFKQQELANATPRALAYRRFLAEQGAPLRVHATYDALLEYFLNQEMELYGWPAWPPDFHDPDSAAVADFVARHGDRVEYFQYLQWCAFEQLRAAQQAAISAGMAVGVYLDLAVGISGAGSEAWSHQHLLCLASSAGAPPDELAREGQDWGFPPPNPAALQDDAYELLIRILKASMSCAGAVRFDHCVSLLRLWWVPRGESALDGGYVSYPLQDFLAVLALESWRNECLVIGEDLGTVPVLLTEVMLDNHLYSYRVLYFEREKGSERLLLPGKYPARSVATVSTHDLPTLASWWDESDLDLRARLNLLGSVEMIGKLRAGRARDKQLLLDNLHRGGHLEQPLRAASIPALTEALNEAVHLYVASSNAAVMIAQVEDWLGMLEPVNIPGTHLEHANWQRKLSSPIEGFFERPLVSRLCSKINSIRSESKVNYSIDSGTGKDAIPGRVEFVSGAGGFTNVRLSCSQGSALVSLYGGQVLSYRPTAAAADLLFLSERAVFESGKAIRGGVPLCWPWFGPDPEGSGRPNHGFARTGLWRVVAVAADTPAQTRITLGLGDSAESRDLWPHEFDLQLVITLDKALTLELVTRNTGADSFVVTQALHTYFSIGDIEEIEVIGLEGNHYLDKTDAMQRKQQHGPVSIDSEVDRIYTGVTKPLLIRDSALNRSIEITGTGSTTAIVWNPWQEASSKVADLVATDYRRFVCVETGNAEQDAVRLAPGEQHCLSARYRVTSG